MIDWRLALIAIILALIDTDMMIARVLVSVFKIGASYATR